MWNAGLDEAEAEIKITRRNVNNLRYANNTTFMAESKEELKRLLRKVKQEGEKAGFKLNIQNTKITAFGPITSCRINRETVTDLPSWSSKSLWTVTIAMKLKDIFLLGRNALRKLDSILKSRDITLPTKVHIVKPMVFPVVMYRCVS